MRILVLHKRGDSRVLLKQLKEAYPTLGQHEETFKLIPVVVTEKFPTKIKNKKFDRIYVDEDTVKIEEIADWLPRIGNPQVTFLNLSNRLKKMKNPKKMRTTITSRIVDLREPNASKKKK